MAYDIRFNTQVTGASTLDKVGDIVKDVSLAVRSASADLRAFEERLRADIVAAAEFGSKVESSVTAVAGAVESAAKNVKTAIVGIGTGYALVTGTMSAFTIQAAGATGVVNNLVNGYRALRIALSPTLFTGVTIGLGILTEETLKLVYARGKLIEQQALYAATSEIPISLIERLDSTAKNSGQDPAVLRSLLATISGRIDNNQSQVRSGLNTLGVSKTLGQKGYEVDPELLGKIAQGFNSIEDPARRAAAAAQLFGDAKADEALKELGFAFADADAATGRFGGTLDAVSRNQIFTATQDFRRLREALTNFSTIKGWEDEAVTGLEKIAAAAERGVVRAVSLSGLHGYFAPPRSILSPDAPDRESAESIIQDRDREIKELTEKRDAQDRPVPLSKRQGEFTTDDGSRWPGINTNADDPSAFEASIQKIRKRADDRLSARNSAYADALHIDLQHSANNGQVASGLLSEAKTARDRARDTTIEGQRDVEQQSKALAQQKYDALAADDKARAKNPSDASLLGPDARLTLATQEKLLREKAEAAAANVVKLTKEKEDAEKAATKAKELAERVKREQSEGVLSSDEIRIRALKGDTNAGKDYASEMTKRSQFVDSDGNIQHIKMLDTTWRNLLAAFQIYVHDLPNKNAAESIKASEEDFAKKMGLEDRLFQYRIGFQGETSKMALANYSRVFASQNILAGYDRDDQNRAVDATGIGLTGVDATRNNLSQIQRKLDIQTTFLKKTSVNDSDAITRDRDHQLAQLEADRANVTDEEYRDRSSVIYGTAGQKGDELNKKYDEDLLKAQQDAVIETTKIIKELENAQIAQFRDLAGGLFDAATSRQPGAIPNYVRAQVLGVGKTITENIAQTYILPEIKNLIPHATGLLAPLLKGTPFEADPLKTSAAPALVDAAGHLIAAAQALATARPGGAGIPGSSGGGIPGSSGGGIPTYNPSTGQFDGSGAQPAAGDGYDIYAQAGVNPSYTGSQASTFTPPSSTAMNVQTVMGIAATAGLLATAAVDFSKGGASKDLQGAGAVAGAVATAVPLIAKALSIASPLLSAIPVIGSIAAVALPLIGSFFNGPQQRQNAINTELGKAQYNAPQALNATQDSSGDFTDFDARGNIRTSDFSAIPTVRQSSTWEQTHGLFDGPPTFYTVPGGQTSQFGAANSGTTAPTPATVVNISAMDVQSFNDFAMKNSAAFGNAGAKALQDSHAAFSTEVQRTAGV